MIRSPLLSLSNGSTIPQVGLGLWQVRDETQFQRAFYAAIDAGYRHFDSAQAYRNEAMLGRAVASCGVSRKELFITTKIRTESIALSKTTNSFDKSLSNLNMEYVDLLLLHFPVPFARKKVWKELEKIHKAGKAKNIGVSNYTIKHLEEMKKYATTMPTINQVELHVFLQQPELLDYCVKEGIIIEAYSPLAHAKVMDDVVVQSIADKHAVSYGQVMLRWCVQKGLVVLPKSVTPNRIHENIDVFDFALDDSDMLALSAINKNLRTCWDPTIVP